MCGVIRGRHGTKHFACVLSALTMSCWYYRLRNEKFDVRILLKFAKLHKKNLNSKSVFDLIFFLEVSGHASV